MFAGHDRENVQAVRGPAERV